MSLGFVLNTDIGVVIAGDGRISIWGTDRIIKEDHQKVGVLSKNAILYISGITEECEKTRENIRNEILENHLVGFNEICNCISKQCHITHNSICNDEKYGIYVDRIKRGEIISLGGFLAHYNLENGTFGYAGFCQSDDFKPSVSFSLGSYNFNGPGQEDAKNVFSQMLSPIQKNIENVVSCLLQTYNFISKQNVSVGGKMSIYLLSKNGTQQLL